jgi:hypothetical protein
LGVGFDSGLSGFDFTLIVSPVLAPSARRLSRKDAGTRCTGIDEESSLEVCEFLEAGAFTQQIVQAFQTGSCKNYQLAQTRTLYCIAQEWPSGHSPLGLC